MAKDIALSRRKPGFEPRWGHTRKSAHSADFPASAPNPIINEASLTRPRLLRVGVRLGSNNALVGVYPACLEGSTSHKGTKLDERARLSRMITEQHERAASEDVQDLPSVDGLLMAEVFSMGTGCERTSVSSRLLVDLQALGVSGPY